MRNDNLTTEEVNENLSFKSSREFGLMADTPIYRVFRADYLKTTISNSANTLVHISKWDDPFEAFLLRQKIFENGTPVDISTFYEDIYGQCWSLNSNESDATWRIYSPDKDGVIVKTTLGKLWDGFYNPNYKLATISFAVGKVEYYPEKDIVAAFNGISFSTLLDSSLSQLTRTLLIKRMEFKHENEIRIIYNDAGKLAQNGLVSYSIDPKDLIEDLVADPRMSDADFQSLQSTLSGQGFSIRRSSLYQLPNLQLKL